MTEVFFLSGWAGPETLFPGRSGQWTFMAPFLDGDEAACLAGAAASRARVLAGWSTGGHMLLKQGRALFPRFERVVLFAPFLRFTDSLPGRLVRAMAANFETDPEDVARGFWRNCGPSPDAPVGLAPIPAWDPAWTRGLARGLDYLLTSEVPEIPMPAGNVTVLSGASDRIVRPTAVDRVLALLDGARLVRHGGGHWPDPSLVTECLFS